MSVRLLITLFVFSTFINACSVYKLDVQQGNALSSETVALLKPGMSKTQVIQILGSPLMADSFRRDRWDYIYYTIQQGKQSRQKNLALYFKDGQLNNIQQ